ncbi:MAG: hypothetical protein WA417_25115 [Stellaceae bacterium]
MPLPTPELGLVVSYAYLWNSEFEEGQEEGVKDRPCALVLSSQNEGGNTIVAVVPVTHTPPERPEEAVEIPAVVKRHLGLDEARSWIVVSEINRFIWPGPDLRPVSRAEPERFEYGFLPPALFRQVLEKFEATVAARRLRTVPRTE